MGAACETVEKVSLCEACETEKNVFICETCETVEILSLCETLWAVEYESLRNSSPANDVDNLCLFFSLYLSFFFVQKIIWYIFLSGFFLSHSISMIIKVECFMRSIFYHESV